MSSLVFYLALVFFTSISQGAPALPTPTDLTTHNRFKRITIPSGAAVVAPLPAPLCVTKNGTNVQTSTKTFAVGEQWMPGLPWSEPGQVVFVSTDTNGVEFENLAFDNAPAALNNFTNLLQPYSNSSGWSMTMPSTANVNVSAPTLTWTATATSGAISSYNLGMTVSWNCTSDKYAPNTTPSAQPQLPFVNHVLVLPALTGCSVNATSTTTWTSAFPVRTGEIQVEGYQGVGQGDFWNNTDAVWSLSVANDTNNQIQFEFPNFMDGDTGSTTIFTMAPSSTGFNFTVPSYYGTPTGPAIEFTATPAPSAPVGLDSYTMVISGVWPCQSDPIANGPYQGATPCVTNDPHFQTDTYNWLFREVDLSMSNYWHNGPTATTPNQPQVPAATPVQTGEALPAQLAWGAANIQVDCHMASSCFGPADLDFCQPDINPILPIWAYLALVSISNLHQQFNNIYNALTIAAVEVGDWGLGFVQEFTNDVALNNQLRESQVALALSGTIISVFAALIPMPNTARVEANIDYLGELAAKKGGGKNPGTPESPDLPPGGPGTPATPIEPGVPEIPSIPQDDPQPASNLDYSFLDPESNAPIPEIFQKGLPHEPPPPGSWEVEQIQESIGKTPQPGRGGYSILGGTIPGNILTGSQTLWAKYDPSSIDIAYQGGIWQSFVGNVTMDMQASLEGLADAILTDPLYTDVLLNYLYGGEYINGEINQTSLQWYLRTDLTSRAINNVWSSYPVYLAFTNLGDPMYGNSTPGCDAHTIGPQSTKFCGNGGVFYLYNLCTTDYMRGGWEPPHMQQGTTEQTIVAFPGQCMPFGLKNFETDGRLNITASGPTEGSARAWNATNSVSITTDDDEALTGSMVGLFGESALDDLPYLVGRLPGEWSLPVCDQGNNTWGADYTANSEGSSVGHLPCACGYQGNTTAEFMSAINVADEDLYELAFYCCEGGLLFPNATQDTPDQGMGAKALTGGIWSGTLSYGYFTAETWKNNSLGCSDKGKLIIN